MAQSYSNKPFLYTLLTDFIALLYPETCIACDHTLLQKESTICLQCQLDLPITKFENYSPNPVEKLFWLKTSIKEASSGFFYSKKSKIQKIIHAFKYRNNPEAALYMGELLGIQLLTSKRFKEIDLIIPVPLHPYKHKQRGYNQSEKLAQGIANALNLPIDTTSLNRITDNSTQTKKGLFNRWTNVKHVFDIITPESIQNKHVLLVDDVITSGATIEACAKQILQIKGTSISIVSLAFAND